MDQRTPELPEFSEEAMRGQVLARIGTASGREQIAQDLRDGAYQRHNEAFKGIVAEAVKPGADQLDIKARGMREFAEISLLGASENPATRKLMTENAEAYARKAGLPFEPVGDTERWAKPDALSPALPDDAKGRLTATTEALDRAWPSQQPYAAVNSLAEQAATRDGRAKIAEEICSGQVRGRLDQLTERFSDIAGSEDKTKLMDFMSDPRNAQPMGHSFALHEADQPGSREGLTDMARQRAERHGETFEEIDPSEPWDSKRPMSEGSCFNASLDVGGAPNRSKSEVAQMIERADRQVMAEGNAKSPVARGRDDALSL